MSCWVCQTCGICLKLDMEYYVKIEKNILSVNSLLHATIFQGELFWLDGNRWKTMCYEPYGCFASLLDIVWTMVSTGGLHVLQCWEQCKLSCLVWPSRGKFFLQESSPQKVFTCLWSLPVAFLLKRNINKTLVCINDERLIWIVSLSNYLGNWNWCHSPRLWIPFRKSQLCWSLRQEWSYFHWPIPRNC